MGVSLTSLKNSRHPGAVIFSSIQASGQISESSCHRMRLTPYVFCQVCVSAMEKNQQHVPLFGNRTINYFQNDTEITELCLRSSGPTFFFVGDQCSISITLSDTSHAFLVRCLSFMATLFKEFKPCHCMPGPHDTPVVAEAIGLTPGRGPRSSPEGTAASLPVCTPNPPHQHKRRGTARSLPPRGWTLPLSARRQMKFSFDSIVRRPPPIHTSLIVDQFVIEALFSPSPPPPPPPIGGDSGRAACTTAARRRRASQWTRRSTSKPSPKSSPGRTRHILPMRV